MEPNQLNFAWHSLLEFSNALARNTSIKEQIRCIKDFVGLHINASYDFYPEGELQEYCLNDPQNNADHSYVIEKIHTEPNLTKILFTSDIRYFVGIPWHLNGKLAGSHIFSKTSSSFTEQEISILEALSQLIAKNFELSVLKQKQQAQQKQIDLVQNVTAQLVNITNLDELARTICDLILNTFNYYYVAVFTLEPEQDELIFRASARGDGSSQPIFEYNLGAKIKVGDHIVGYVAKTGEQLVANDVFKEPRYGHLETLDQTQAEAAIPLIINEQVVGVLDIQSESIHAFTEDDLQLLNALANNIAIAVHRVRLFDAVLSRNVQLDAIEEVSQAITYILDLNELLEKVVDLIHTNFGYEYVHVFLVQPAEKRITFKAGSGARTQIFKTAQVSYSLNSEKGIIVTAARSGQIKCVNDVSTSAEYLPAPLSDGFSGSELAIPLTFGRQVLGVLDIQTEKTNAFTEQDQELLGTLSANIAIAVRNANLYHSETWRRQVAESLRDVAISLTDNKSTEKVFESILSELATILPYDAACVWLVEDEGEVNPGKNRFIPKVFKVSDAISPEALRSISGSNGAWFEQAIDLENPLIRKAGDGYDPIGEQLDFPEDYSAIAAPLQTGDQISGMLTLHHQKPNRYGIESQKITSSFASYASISIENIRLYESSQEQAWISTVLLQVAQATQSLNTIPELVSTVVRLTPLLVGVEGCALFLRESDSPTFLLHDYYGSAFSETSIKLPLTIKSGEIFDILHDSQTPKIIDDSLSELGIPADLINDADKKLKILLPLITHNELLGGFLLVQSPMMNHETNDEILNDQRLSIIQGITQQTAIAVENIRLFEAKQEEAYVSAALLQVAQAVVSSDNLDDTLDSIVHIMPYLVGIEHSVIYIWDVNSEKYFASYFQIPEQFDGIEELRTSSYSDGDFPLLDAVRTLNKPVIHPLNTPLPPDDWDLAIPDESISDTAAILSSPYGLLMGFPLSVKEEHYGVLAVQEANYKPSRSRRFDLVNGIAQQASLAIQNDHLNKERADRERMDREFQLARQIQRTFLPESLPSIEGYDTDVRWRTARQVGGDFYDIFKLTDNHYGIVIADVSDKGLAASLYMTVARTLLRAAALESHSPARTLEKVNDLFLLNSETGLFVTIFYAILDTDSGNMVYSNAGHNIPYLMRASDHKLQELKGGGIAIGALPDIKLPEVDITLNPGDALVLHTDGVTETFNSSGEMYGDKRYRKTLLHAMGLEASQILDLIEAEISDFRRSAPLSDDLTLVAIKRDSIDKSMQE